MMRKIRKRDNNFSNISRLEYLSNPKSSLLKILRKMDLECTFFESLGNDPEYSLVYLTCVVEKIFYTYGNEITILKKELRSESKAHEYFKWASRIVFNNFKIGYFPRGIRTALKYLRQVIVVNCEIKSINREDFKDLHSLTELNLSGNEITKLDKNVFADLANLSSLFLSNNKIAAISRCCPT